MVSVKDIKKKIDKRRMLVIINIAIPVFIILFLFLFNYFGALKFKRYDMTDDQRYSLLPESIEFLDGLEQDIKIQVLLGVDDLPYDYLRLKEAIEQKLDEMKAYSGSNLEYEFIDPFDNATNVEKEERKGQLKSSGIFHVRWVGNKDDGKSERIFYAGAKILIKDENGEYNDYYPINFLPWNFVDPRYQKVLSESDNRLADETRIAVEEGINNLESTLIRGLYDLLNFKTKSIAFLQGHYESPVFIDTLIRNNQPVKNIRSFYLDDVVNKLNRSFQLDVLTLKSLGSFDEMMQYDMIVISNPKVAFNDMELFLLDQYVMHGGKVFWLLDFVRRDPAKIKTTREYLEFDDLNLLRYFNNLGVSPKQHVIGDLNCGTTKLSLNNKLEVFNYVFYPILNNSMSDNMITHNIGEVISYYPTVLDINEDKPEITKTILLNSSDSSYTKSPGDYQIGYFASSFKEEGFRNKLRKDKKKFVSGLLLEGEFTSLYKEKLTNPNHPQYVGYTTFCDSFNLDYKVSAKNKMIVVGDGEMLENQLIEQGEGGPVYPLPLGVHRHYYEGTGSGYYPGNMRFAVNSIDYLLDRELLIKLRSKDIKERLMRKDIRTDDNLWFNWQLLNTALPILIVIVFAVAMIFIRKIRFSK
jgi:gliding-associated putative ABC transporter substrate-binding component GldG